MRSGRGIDDGFLRSDEIAEIRAAFFDQARAALDSLSQDILTLEGELPTPSRLRPLRRSVHTLKGDCGSVGFPKLSGLAHALEDALAAIEDSARPVSARHSDLLLAAVDLLRSGLEAGARGETEPDAALLVERLRAISGAWTATAPSAWDAKLGQDQRRALLEAAARGERAFHLTVEFSGRSRRRDASLRGLLERLGLAAVAQDPGGPLGHAPRCEVLAVGRGSGAEHQARARETRGIQVRVEETRIAPEAPSPTRVSDAPREGETVRIEARRVDEVLNLVGELVTARSTIAAVTEEIERLLPEELAGRLGEAQSLLGRVLQDLQRSAMRMRMVPADRVFRRFSRVVRDLGRRTGKQLVLKVEGENTELDRGILDALEEPLLHLVRNAADHGIESPEGRHAAGKPAEGRVTLRASREGNQILIEVLDNGRGIDVDRVRRKAVETALLTAAEAEALPEAEALQLVFHPGLSTAETVTETSGRGVGLDVVRETVEGLKGSVRAANLPEGGASFLIRVPLTVAIIQALLFRAGGRDLAVPLTSVVEIARRSDLQVHRLPHGEIVKLREEVLSLVRVGELLGWPDTADAPGFVVVVRSSAGRFGLVVDDLGGEQELVIKAVHDRFIRTPLVAGASVVGAGSLVLILDVLSVYRAALAQGATHHA